MGKPNKGPSKEELKQKKIKKKQQRKQMQKKREMIRENLKKEKPVSQTIETVDVIEQSENILTGKYYDYFKGVFERNQAHAKKYYETEILKSKEKPNQEPKEEAQKEQKFSRKQMKTMRWLKVAELKARVARPDLVQAWDITAPDPLFLCELKKIKNTVPVPRHWNQKSKFLQTKRGILKPMFKLPQFIQATGISKLRDPFSQRDGSKMVKQKMRERMNPRLGKIDIEYSVLHDAFFKYQLKSELTVFGDIYYQGKQDEAKAKQFKPGLMGENLRIALGISDYQAPPWIINMQRYGGPPSYPTLRILGSNMPFAQLTSYAVINKTNLEEAAKKLGQPGLYATFKTYYEEEEEQFVDKGYWGQINNLQDNVDQPQEGWEEDDQNL